MVESGNCVFCRARIGKQWRCQDELRRTGQASRLPAGAQIELEPDRDTYRALAAISAQTRLSVAQPPKVTGGATELLCGQ